MDYHNLQIKLDQHMPLTAEEKAWLIKNNHDNRKQITISKRSWQGLKPYPDSVVDKRDAQELK